jgi:outer membrane protein assembly factor BamC
MKSRHFVPGLIVVTMLAGCSIFEHKQVDYKAGAAVTPSLEVPPDLTVPETDQRYVIPGSNGKQSASYSEYSKQKSEEPCANTTSAPAAAPASPPPETPAASLRAGKGGKYIMLGEPFDRSWRRVGLALDHARIKVTDKDRSKGIYFVAPIPDKDSKDNKKQPDYQVVVHGTGKHSKVTVVDQNGKRDAAASKLVQAIYQNLDKGDRGNSGRDAVRSSR